MDTKRSPENVNVVSNEVKKQRTDDNNATETRKPHEKPMNSRMPEGNTSKIGKALNSVFGSLELDKTNALEEVGHKVHVRNHVNPLSSVYSKPVDAPKWNEVFKDPNLPLFIDIGCAAGRFGLAAALSEQWKSHNHLGLEIRDPLVQRANVWAKAKNLENVHYVSCSVNSSVDNLLGSYPGKIDWVAVQFPDPHFKKKHHKRRVVQEDLLNRLGKYMGEGSTLFLQSDVEETAAQMRDRTQQCKYFTRFGEYSDRDALLDIDVSAKGSDESLWTRDGKRAKPDGVDYGDWLKGENPVGIPTEREVQNQALELPIYRCLFKRNDVAFDEDKA